MSGNYDFIDKARHWLIRKLACGDLIMLNFSMNDEGLIDRRNLGPVLVADVKVEPPPGVSGISVGGRKKQAHLNFRFNSYLRLVRVHVAACDGWGIRFRGDGQ